MVFPSNPVPGPSDAIIGFTVSCGTANPGLDGKRDRVIRISYRSRRLPDRPRDQRPQHPPLPTGAFPLPDREGRIKGPRTGGVLVTPDGTVWIDVQVYGQPPAGARGDDGNLLPPLGDDSEAIASRILEAVEAAEARGLIAPGDIEVQHNGQSDTQPEAGPCPYGKPQSNGRGRGRIILKDPSHVDAACDYSKIRMTIILLPPDGSSPPRPPTIIIPDSVPSRMPDERRPRDWRDNPRWTDTGHTDRTDRRDHDDPNGDVAEYQRRDLPWQRPPMRERRWSTIRFSYNIPPQPPEPVLARPHSGCIIGILTSHGQYIAAYREKASTLGGSPNIDCIAASLMHIGLLAYRRHNAIMVTDDQHALRLGLYATFWGESRYFSFETSSAHSGHDSTLPSDEAHAGSQTQYNSSIDHIAIQPHPTSMPHIASRYDEGEH
jgi:hypothetical protein